MKKRIILALVLMSATILTTGSDRVSAADGDLDPIFNSTGKYIGTTSGQFGYAVAVQSDQKIVVATQLSFQVILERHNIDGSLDSSFGVSSTGKTAPVSGLPRAIAIDTSGNIFVAGYGDDSGQSVIFLWKYDTTGSPDTNFGTNGRATINVGSGEDRAFGLALQSDGKVLVAGHSLDGGSSRLVVIRFTANGQLDTSFNASNSSFGIPGTFVAGSASGLAGRDLHVLPNGDILVAGFGNMSVQPSGGDFLLVRLNIDGTVDTEFGNNGWSQFDLGGRETAARMAVSKSGKIHVAGYTNASGGGDMAVVRVNANGGLDGTFGNSGSQIVSFGPDLDFAEAIEVQTDGKIFLGGRTEISGSTIAQVARLTEEGNLDSSFGSGGKVTLDSDPWTDFEDMALQADGKLVATGSQNTNLSIFRFKATSTNSSLSALAFSDGSSQSQFGIHPQITTYSGSISNSVSTITVTPTLADPNATVTVNGQNVTSGNQSNSLAMQEGTNTVTIIVTAQDGTTTTNYTLTITRAAATTTTTLAPSTTTTLAPSTTTTTTLGNSTSTSTVPTSPNNSGPSAEPQSTGPLLQAIQVTRAQLTPAFDVATTSYQVSVTNSTKTVNVTGVSLDGSHLVAINSEAPTVAYLDVPIRLSVGRNTVSVHVMSPTSGASQTYSVVITREYATLKRGKSMSVSAALRTADITLIKGARTTITVARSSSKFCRATSSRVTARNKGTCRLTVTATKGRSKKRYSVTLIVR